MSVESRYTSKLTVTRTFDTTTADGGTATTTSENTRPPLNALSTPPVTEGGTAEKAMTAGAATIDLSALVTQDGRTVNLTGLKLRQWKLKAPATNGAAVTVAKGAASGFTGFGAAFSLSLLPGMEVACDDAGAAGAVAVAGGVKTLDLSGTTTDKVQLVFAAGA